MSEDYSDNHNLFTPRRSHLQDCNSHPSLGDAEHKDFLRGVRVGCDFGGSLLLRKGGKKGRDREGLGGGIHSREGTRRVKLVRVEEPSGRFHPATRKFIGRNCLLGKFC